jgi:hypothetical protein
MREIARLSTKISDQLRNITLILLIMTACMRFTFMLMCLMLVATTSTIFNFSGDIQFYDFRCIT